jgi:hypothetical protein
MHLKLPEFHLDLFGLRIYNQLTQLLFLAYLLLLFYGIRLYDTARKYFFAKVRHVPIQACERLPNSSELCYTLEHDR